MGGKHKVSIGRISQQRNYATLLLGHGHQTGLASFEIKLANRKAGDTNTLWWSGSIQEKPIVRRKCQVRELVMGLKVMKLAASLHFPNTDFVRARRGRRGSRDCGSGRGNAPVRRNCYRIYCTPPTALSVAIETGHLFTAAGFPYANAPIRPTGDSMLSVT